MMMNYFKIIPFSLQVGSTSKLTCFLQRENATSEAIVIRLIFVWPKKAGPRVSMEVIVTSLEVSLIQLFTGCRQPIYVPRTGLSFVLDIDHIIRLHCRCTTHNLLLL